VLVAIVLATVAGAPRAWAYVRSRVPPGCEVLSDDPVSGCIETAWSRNKGTCIPVSIYLDRFADMTGDEVAKSIGAAAHTWSPSMVTCPTSADPTHPFLEIVPGMAPLEAASPPPADDGRNVVRFQLEDVIPSNVIALTTRFDKKDGRTLGTDVELNAFHFSFANLDPPFDAGDSRIDLQAAVTHEFGHFLGLGHTCFQPGGSDRSPPIDHLGNAVPFCDDASAEIEATVMFAQVKPGDIRKRTLTADDIAGVCAIYPEVDSPRVCALDLPDDGCGCASGGRGGGAGALAFVLLALVTTGRARRGCRAPMPRPASTRR
jgi:hypothetical protein